MAAKFILKKGLAAKKIVEKPEKKRIIFLKLNNSDTLFNKYIINITGKAPRIVITVIYKSVIPGVFKLSFIIIVKITKSTQNTEDERI